nr:hypothetical protein Iba_chr09fCG12410 [Ipomoea batatas]
MRISQARSSGETYAFPKCAYLLIPISNLGRGVNTNFDFTPALGSSSNSSSALIVMVISRASRVGTDADGGFDRSLNDRSSGFSRVSTQPN